MKFFEKLALNPPKRMRQHIDYLRKHIEIKDKSDAKNFDTVHKTFVETGSIIAIWRWIRNIAFIFLYVGVVSAMVAAVSDAFAVIFEPIRAVNAIVGVGLFTVLFIVAQYFMKLYTYDMVSEHAHLVSILVKENDSFVVHPHYSFGVFKSYDAKKGLKDK